VPAVQATGNGNVQSVTAPRLTSPQAFYRATVQDVDTDGDRVSDWAEIVTGFDPNSTHSHGASVDDHTALTTQLPNENIVTLTATEPSATQPPNAQTTPTTVGSITVSRAGRLNFSAITLL
jgi:microcystin-dependent protein